MRIEVNMGSRFGIQFGWAVLLSLAAAHESGSAPPTAAGLAASDAA